MDNYVSNLQCRCRLVCLSLSQIWPLACINFNMSSCWNILVLNLALLLEIFIGLWTSPVHFIYQCFYTFDFLENNSQNGNTPAWDYPHQGSVITVKVVHCWLGSSKKWVKFWHLSESQESDSEISLSHQELFLGCHYSGGIMFFPNLYSYEYYPTGMVSV